MKFKTGDQVVVVTGKYKGKTGKIMRILHKTDKVVVEQVNIITKHVKKTASQAGQKIQYEGPIHISNVMIIDPKTKKRARIGYKKLETGKKSRIYKKSGEEIINPERKVKAKQT